MAGGSEEYLADLGFDTSDAEKSTQRMITLLGHLGNQFDDMSKKTEKAERALSGTGRAAQGTTSGVTSAAKAQKEQASAAEIASKQNALYNQYLYDQAKATEAAAANAPRLRYALYDVAGAATAATAAVGAVGALAISAGASYESAFSNVERTVEPGTASIAGLREQLKGLSQEIPRTFQDLSAIATLGNQLGINADELVRFTEIVAKFSTVSGMTAEASAQAFGILKNVLQLDSVEELNSLANAIELTGVRSASTDQQIIALAQRLGATATRAGFTADQVVGLAGAVGSLGVAPERAQGVFETYFNSINEALAEGGQKAEDFATITGRSISDLNTAVRSGQGFSVFQDFIEGLQNTDTVQLTDALDRLGLSGLRANEVIGRISGNMGLLKSSFDTAAQGASEATELDRQFAVILDDLSSKWTFFTNSLMTFAATASGALFPALGGILDLTTQLLLGLSEFANTPFGAGLTVLAGIIGGLVVVLGGATGTAAVAAATFLALRTAAQEMGLMSAYAAGGVRGLFGALLGVGPAATSGAIGLRIFRLALITTGIGALIVALGFLIGLMVDFNGTMVSLQGPINFAIDVIYNLAKAAIFTGRAIAQALSILPGYGDAFKGVASLSDKAINNQIELARSITKTPVNNWINSLKTETEEYVPAAEQAADATLDFGNALGAPGGLSDSAQDAQKEVRTLVDYANDLQQVFSRAFDIRFGGGSAMDTITSGWNAIRDSIDQTNQKIAEYQATMQSLSSDKAIREYWLSVAENYGDALRAGALRAEIAEIDNKLAKTSGDLTKEQAKNSRGLEGNSDAAINNRSQILGLVQNYQSYITALAASGASQEELNYQSQLLKQQFIEQAVQLGYSRDEVGKYAAAFDDMTLAIGRVPRNITVKADINPAIQALNELQARAAQSGRAAGQDYANGFGGSTGGLSINVGAAQGAALGGQFGTAFATQAKQNIIDKLNTIQSGALGTGAGSAIGGQAGLRFYRSGTSWTGSGNPWEVAGVVHNREAVLNQRGTAMVGSEFVNAANQGRNPWAHAPAQAASVNMPGSMMVQLSPVDRELLAAGKEVTVILGGDSISHAGGAADSDDSRRGGA